MSYEVRKVKLSKLHINTGQIAGVPRNPRFIRDEKFRKLCDSLEQDPEFTELKEVTAYEMEGGELVVVDGNMRYRAAKELKWKELTVKIIPTGTPADKIMRYIIKSNLAYGENDWDLIANEWDISELVEMGMDLPVDWEADTEETEAEEYERKKREFEERIKSGELSEDNEEYQEFLAKFEAKKTTDDCYTPAVVYEAVADWVANEYKLNKAKFKRPFYPNGDYQREVYKKNEVVVDNPPFSILAEIVDFYNERNIKYFLFAPHLTAFSSMPSRCTVLPIGVGITYENGANVNTAFVTNLEEGIVARSEPRLYKAVKDANTENLKNIRKHVPEYIYDNHVALTPLFARLSRGGFDFCVKREECLHISHCDAQKEQGKSIFGGGLLMNDRLTEECKRLEGERIKQEEEERLRKIKGEGGVQIWTLSAREKALIDELNKNAPE